MNVSDLIENGDSDAERWNHRFKTAPRDWFQTPRPILTEHLHWLPHHGIALDAAMGPGHNAVPLVDHGLRVLGVDISLVAAQIALRRSPGILAVVADLNHFELPEQQFDVILNLYYLQRSLFPAYARALKPGGILIFEALLDEMRQTRPELNPDRLLTAGELRAAFGEWDILYDREGWTRSDHGHQKAVASLVARRPNHL